MNVYNSKVSNCSAYATFFGICRNITDIRKKMSAVTLVLKGQRPKPEMTAGTFAEHPCFTEETKDQIIQLFAEKKKLEIMTCFSMSHLKKLWGEGGSKNLWQKGLQNPVQYKQTTHLAQRKLFILTCTE